MQDDLLDAAGITPGEVELPRLSHSPEVKALSSGSDLVSGWTGDTPSYNYIRPPPSSPDLLRLYTQHVATTETRTCLPNYQQKIRPRLGPLPSRKELRRWHQTGWKRKPEGTVHSDR